MHDAVASTANKSQELTEAVVADYRTAPISEQLRAMLAFLDKLHHGPSAVDSMDAQAVRDAGVSRAALADGLSVAATFHFINRCSDAFDFEVVSEEGARDVSKLLARLGYKL